MLEETFVLIKPDGIQKGAEKIICEGLEKLGLRVVSSIHISLCRKWVAQLYIEHKGQDFYFRTLEWLSSAQVIIMKIQGEDAIFKAKFQVIGRYPNGIRGQLAESSVKNVAHASESSEAARRELKLAESFFSDSSNTISRIIEKHQ